MSEVPLYESHARQADQSADGTGAGRSFSSSLSLSNLELSDTKVYDP